MMMNLASLAHESVNACLPLLFLLDSFIFTWTLSVYPRIYIPPTHPSIHPLKSLTFNIDISSFSQYGAYTECILALSFQLSFDVNMVLSLTDDRKVMISGL